MRMIVAALVALSLPVSIAQAQERPALRRAQQQMNWNSGLIEGRQSTVTSFPRRDIVSPLDVNNPRVIEDNLFDRVENRRGIGVGG